MNPSIQKIENQTASKSAWFSFWPAALGIVLALVLTPPSKRSHAQDWIASLERTHRALTGLDLESSRASDLANTPKDRRTEVFDKFLGELLASDAYARAQSDAWMLDHFAYISARLDAARLDAARLDAAGWDTPGFRRWLIDRYQDNTPYDRFVQSQLDGTNEPSSSLATHAWYLAGQRSNYKIAEYPTPIESNLVRQFRTALASIERSEEKDWQRLLAQTQQLQRQEGANPVRDYWQAQRTWPTVADQDPLWTWPDPTAIDFGPHEFRVVSNPPKLRWFRPWTLALVARFPKELLAQPEPVCIFEQSQTAESQTMDPARAQRAFRLELSQGRLVVRLIHDARISCHVVQTKEALPAEAILHLAITNDGLGRSDSIRVVIDGQCMSTEPVDASWRIYKEIVSKEPSSWRIGTSGHFGWRLEQATLYRECLSLPEIQGLADALWIDDWNEMEPTVQTQWIEHYAKRFDSQWKYQRESRDHYASNIAAVLESQSMLPVLYSPEEPIFLVQSERFPNSLVSLATSSKSPIPSLEPTSPSALVQTQANRWRIESGGKLEPQSLARSEIQRTWRAMLRYASKSQRNLDASKVSDASKAYDPIDADLVHTLAIDFMRDWNRRAMVRKLVERLLQTDAIGPTDR